MESKSNQNPKTENTTKVARQSFLQKKRANVLLLSLLTHKDSNLN